MRRIGFIFVGRFFSDSCLFFERCLIRVSFFSKSRLALGREFYKILIFSLGCFALVFGFVLREFVVFVVLMLGCCIDL